MSQKLIELCSENFNFYQRRLSLKNQLFLFSIPRPKWLKANRDDKLHDLFNNFTKVFKEGRVVWGHIVQANSQLYEDGTKNLPAQGVFSLNESYRGDPDHLFQLASSVYDLKQRDGVEGELSELYNSVSCETERSFGLRIPSALSRERCYVTTLFISRDHLPDKKLSRPLVPLVVL